MFLAEILKNKRILAVFAAGFILFLIAGSLVYLKLSDAGGLLVIHFDYLKGIDFLGNKNDVSGILAVGLAMYFINLVLADAFYEKERFFSYLFASVSLAVSILILTAISVIISVN